MKRIPLMWIPFLLRIVASMNNLDLMEKKAMSNNEDATFTPCHA